ncbi:hypothetical protein HD554DRAFT_1249783 [Boletus coccyginus]|nr:hypothetical protein HD554DRAFT_1249783 [Boletus coccyginus]
MSMSEDSAYAATPFDHAKADIILRSSDNIDFRVFKLFLTLASPFFETLFEIPQPTEPNNDQEIKDGLAVIRVQENEKTLDTLLRFCYPCTLAEDPKLEALEDLVDVLEAARKYSLDTIERKVHQALSNPKIMEAEPLRCFAIARRGRAREETLLAAKYTLTQPLIPPWFEEIGLITAADLLALLTYHQTCGNAVYALRNDMSWIQSHYGSIQGCPWLSKGSEKPRRGKGYGGFSEHDNSSCLCASLTTGAYSLFGSQPLEWWGDFMEETFVALRDKPCRETVESFVAKTVQSVRKQNCPTCSVNISGHMRDFSELLTRKVDEIVSKIELVMVF